MKSSLPKDLHLVHEEDLPVDAFVSPSGAVLKVKCIFQIWERKKEERVDSKYDAGTSKIQFVKSADADFAVRKIGDKSLGKIVGVHEVTTPNSFFFFKDAPGLKDAIKRSTWSHIKGTAAGGLRSISRQEFAEVVSKNL